MNFEFRDIYCPQPPELKDGEPCGHPGCLSHVTHPCEGCGRIAGFLPKYVKSVYGMFNGWRTTMHGDANRHNGGPRPADTDNKFPIGKRVYVEIHGLTKPELDAFKKGLDAGLIPEIWLSEDGKFA